jgi:hypothetical protein
MTMLADPLIEALNHLRLYGCLASTRSAASHGSSA